MSIPLGCVQVSHHPARTKDMYTQKRICISPIQKEMRYEFSTRNLATVGHSSLDTRAFSLNLFDSAILDFLFSPAAQHPMANQIHRPSFLAISRCY